MYLHDAAYLLHLAISRCEFKEVDSKYFCLNSVQKYMTHFLVNGADVALHEWISQVWLMDAVVG